VRGWRACSAPVPGLFARLFGCLPQGWAAGCPVGPHRGAPRRAKRLAARYRGITGIVWYHGSAVSAVTDPGLCLEALLFACFPSLRSPCYERDGQGCFVFRGWGPSPMGGSFPALAGPHQDHRFAAVPPLSQFWARGNWSRGRSLSSPRTEREAGASGLTTECSGDRDRWIGRRRARWFLAVDDPQYMILAGEQGNWKTAVRGGIGADRTLYLWR
jgi:hypothetical protein